MKSKIRAACAAVATTLLAVGTSGAAMAAIVNGTHAHDNLTGTPGEDTIRGFAGNDHLYAKGGADNVRGYAGKDTLVGNAGPDLLRGGSGGDGIDGLMGQDALYGGAGPDYLAGGLRHDLHYAGAGNDVIYLSYFGDEQGRDYANCGPGFDKVYVDPGYNDEIAPNCERILVTRPH